MKQVNLRICQTILTLMLGLFLSVGAYAQNITVKGHVKDALSDRRKCSGKRKFHEWYNH